MNNQPTWLVLTVAILAGGSLVGAILSAIGTRRSQNLGVKADERKARVDERAGENMLIDQLQEELVRVRSDRDGYEEKYEIEHAYVEVLRRRLWELGDWPPPSRPPREE